MNHPFTIPEAEPATVTHFEGTAPAAGAAYVYTCPAGVIQHIVCCDFLFVADGNAASRFLSVRTQRGAIPYQVHRTPQAVTAGQTRGFSWITNILRSTIWATTTYFLEPLSSKLILLPGDEFRIEAEGVQAGDQIDPIRITMQVWETG